MITFYSSKTKYEVLCPFRDAEVTTKIIETGVDRDKGQKPREQGMCLYESDLGIFLIPSIK